MSQTSSMSVRNSQGEFRAREPGAPPRDLGLLILNYLPLARSVARRVHSTLPPHSGVELSDLIQAGHVGLVSAGHAYNCGSKVPFPVFARYRIRGEILDSLRKLDGASRSLRKWQKAADARAAHLLSSLQRDPTEEELSQSLGVPLDDLRGHRQELHWLSSRALPSDNALPDPQSTSREGMPEAMRGLQEQRKFLHNAAGVLQSRARAVIVLYYHREMTMKEIAGVLKINESRVSQIHKGALAAMANSLRSSGIRRYSDFL